MYTLTEKTFGEWLKHHRKARGLTQRQLAQQISCSTITLRKIEAEERRPSTQIVEKLAQILNIDENERAAFIQFARGNWNSPLLQKPNNEPWQLSTAGPIRNNLPSPTTSLIGRKQEIAEIQAYLFAPEIRLVTLVGSPGIGKTRVGIETARETLQGFPDGVFLISLAPLNNPLLITNTVVQVLGFIDKKNRSALETLKDGIGDKQMLLILDNCEHLIEEAATLASELLSACPQLKIIATSRESLRILGEWQYSVPALDLPKEDTPLDLKNAAHFPALTLFQERAHAVRPDFNLTAENLQSVISICSKLDGLPLAIELMASRMRIMSPQVLLAHMNDQLLQPVDEMRTASEHQKTLKNAIGWSYDFLPPEEKKFFVFLSIFSGGFTLKAAESVFSGMVSEKTVTEIVTSLSDKSLLIRSMDEDDEFRFYMLFIIRQFASDHFKNNTEEQNVRQSHLAYFLNLAIQANQEIHGARQVRWLKQLNKENDNFRNALEYCLSQENVHPALQLLSALSWFWGLWRHNSELNGWFEKLRRLPGVHEYPTLYAQLLNHIGNSSWLAGNFEYARNILEEAIQLWEKMENDGCSGLAQAQCYLGMVIHSMDADYQTSQSLLAKSLGLFQDCANPWGIALASVNLGWVHDHQDHDEAAQKYLEQSLELFSELGDFWGMGRSSQFLGQLFLKQGRYNLAERYFKQHLSIDESLQFAPGIVVALGNLGDLFRFQEKYAEAEKYFLKSLKLGRDYGVKVDRGYNYYALGMLGLQNKDYAYAARYIKRYFESGSSVSLILATTDLCLGLAAVAGALNQPERAARLYGAAQHFLEITDIPYTPFDWDIFNRHIQLARDQLGEATFSVLIGEGQQMTVEESIAYALNEQDSPAEEKSTGLS